MYVTCCRHEKALRLARIHLFRSLTIVEIGPELVDKYVD